MMERRVSDSLTSVLANNRSEHIGMDVWEDFVIPYFYRRIDFNSSLPLRLEGGRGSGKTMLLRYLSYHSRFSEKRLIIPERELEFIGFYLRADTQFLRQLQKRGIEEEIWHSTFSHYINIYLLSEIASAVIKISKSTFENNCEYNTRNVKLDSLEVYNPLFSAPIEALSDEFNKERKRCELAVANPRLLEKITFLPDSCLTDLINEINEKISPIKSKFKVYFDEYENLLKYQQLIINTRMKHSEPPLIFNIAAKLNGVPHTETTGNESLSYKHDYTIEDLDQLLAGESFNCFAAEILFLRLSKTNSKFKDIFNGIQLNSLAHIEKRLEPAYQDLVIREVHSLLPGNSHEELASEVFAQPKLRRKLLNEIEVGLKNKRSNIPAVEFLDETQKRASIVCSSLLFRKSVKPEDVLEELRKLSTGSDNKFSGSTSWLQNFFIGSYLKLTRPYKNEATFYAGFDVYVLLSNGNMRHFLELCRTAFSNFSVSDGSNIAIKPKAQHISAMQTSEIL